MPGRLEEMVAVVTGVGTGGLGEAIARRLVTDGARVVAVDNEADRLAGATAELPNGQVLAIEADLAGTAWAPEVMRGATERWGRLDIVINNAATYPSMAWNDYDPETWDRVMAVNVRAPYLLVREAAPLLSGSPAGSVVNIASITTDHGDGPLPYVTSKGAVISMTRALARELGPEGVRVNAVSPGAFPTRADLVHPDQAAFTRTVLERQCLPRRGTVGELADTVAWLAGPEASFITGQVVRADGGWEF